MRDLVLLLVALICVSPVLGASDIPLPWGGPFVNEDIFPEDGDPSEFFWVEITLVDGDGNVEVTCEKGDAVSVPVVFFAAMKGDVNRILLIREMDRRRVSYTIHSERMVRILHVSGGGLVHVGFENPIMRLDCRTVKYRPDGDEVLKANLDLIRHQVPVPSFSWVPPDLDVARSDVILQKLRDERMLKKEAEYRERVKRRHEQENAEQRERRRESAEREQLAMVEQYKAEFKKGRSESGLRVSFYYAAYSKKLVANGRNVEAARVAAEAFKWLRMSAEAGSARAQQTLGWHLLNGGNTGIVRPGAWSGPRPDVPRDNAYVSPAAFQGTDVLADVLLSETNGVRTYYRVYKRDPVEGVRMMKLADESGDPWARMWVRDHLANMCDLSMPRWFLAKDGFSVAGKTAVEYKEVVVRPGFGTPVKRKIGKDAEGLVVSVSDEYFAQPLSPRHDSPWHEASETCVITEVKP